MGLFSEKVLKFQVDLEEKMKNYNCKLKNCLLCAILAIFMFVCLITIMVAVCSMVNEFLNYKSALSAIFNTLLGGIVGSIISARFVYLGLRDNNTSKQVENQLRLREMFAEERRWKVYRSIQTKFKDTSYWYKQEKENLPANSKIDYTANEKDFMKSKAYEHYFIPALNDYLGLLEVAYMMLEKNQLSE